MYACHFHMDSKHLYLFIAIYLYHKAQNKETLYLTALYVIHAAFTSGYSVNVLKRKMAYKVSKL